MAIYVFSLLVGYLPNGVNNAQGIRNAFLKKTNQTVKYIFAELPRETDIQRYTDDIYRIQRYTVYRYTEMYIQNIQRNACSCLLSPF